MPEYTRMEPYEFMRKILEGERDFRGIGLPEGANLTTYETFEELQSYLREADLQSAPVNVSGSRFHSLRADTIHLPHVKAERASFWGACFREANFSHADFSHADLRAVRFHRANLQHALIRGANVILANFWCADLRFAELRDLIRPDCAQGWRLTEMKDTLMDDVVVKAVRGEIDKATLYKPDFVVTAALPAHEQN